MQSKIRVYESGRSEQVIGFLGHSCMTDFPLLSFSFNSMLLWLQEYDPDLPPELAAAAGHRDISADNGYHGRADNRQTDFNSQGSGPANIRAPIV